MDQSKITGRQISAARSLAGLSQAEVAKAANVSVPTLKRMEGATGAVPGMANNVAAVVRSLQAAGVTFIDGAYSGSGGPGVRLFAPTGDSIDTNEDETIQYKDMYENDAPPGAGG